jgi:TetR/AcrR family transcriptional regulator of autoinduction and epiphytic fitness
MQDQNRTKRKYVSHRRQAQARETQSQIVQASRRLFIERGYTGTTIEQIAVEAGVAVETVYATFGSKRAVLSRLVGASVVGDNEPVPLLEREGPQLVRRERDQHRQLEAFAHGISEIMERRSRHWTWVTLADRDYFQLRGRVGRQQILLVGPTETGA